MQTFALFGLLATAASVAAQGITASIAPSSAPPSGCQTSYSGQFEITTVTPSGTGKRDLLKRQSSSCGQPGILTISLAGSKLTDNLQRTGYIAANSQFQFDAPPQTGAIYTAGFSVCSNGSLAIGGSTTFYSCQSGNIYNLYTASQGLQCQVVNIDIIPCAGSSSVSGSAAPVSVSSSQPAGTVSASMAPVSQSSDAQPQATAPATSIAPVSVFTDGQPQATASATKVPVSVFSDGQPQATVNATAKASPTIVTAGGALFTAPAVMAVAGAIAAAFL